MAQHTARIIRGLDLDTGSGLPLARRLARGLEGLIRSGELQSGQKLPPTAELADLLGISRQVAQDGLALLARRNLVRRRRGLGTMVLEPGGRPTAGLLAFVGGTFSLTADVGWVIASDFLEVTERRGWEHRQYVTRRENRPPGRVPANLVSDLLEGRLDVLVVGAVYEGIVRQNVPSSEVPVLHLNPRQTEALPAVEDAARWLWRRDCRKVGALVQSVPEAEQVTGCFAARCADFRMDAPAGWVRSGCESSIRAGRDLFRDLYCGEETPDGLLVMDDMVGYGLIEEARERGYPLDSSRIVVMVNKGSSLYIPPACPRIELDWRAVIERELDRWLEAEGRAVPADGRSRELYQFVPRGSDEKAAEQPATVSG